MARRTRNRTTVATASVAVPPQGGRFRPLDTGGVIRIIQAAIDILANTGIGECPADLARRMVEAGASRRADGRICFPQAMVETAIARAAQRVNLPGYVEDRGLTIGGGSVHIGTGGAATEILDSSTGSFRGAQLGDLYDLMRLVGQLPNIHYGLRPVIARDMDQPFLLDMNTGFACLKACDKPIGISFDSAAHMDPVVSMFDLALGREGGFRAQPFCFGVIVHAVSPLRYAPEGLEIMQRAMAHRMPLQICTAAQAGATSPVTLAGALAQGLAETLAGLMVVDVIESGYPCIFAFMPFISDLRTGAMTGGSGEAAVAAAAAAQLLLHLGLPSTASAGMTDAKTPDAQAGYEKGYTVALSAQAGADMINLSVGMLGSIMAASREALVIDDDMCGAILRTVRGVEMTNTAIDLDRIEAVATGAGHYLGEAQTLELMKTEYVYPSIGNRQSISDWMDAGSRTVWDVAKDRTAALLAEQPSHLPAAREAAIRAAFDIRLPEES
ncbi:trimethylamine methyltransferase family protein [Sulfitobacter aestuariivivens]|uniref:Trimethylamine methyltransferase family protein n=1 Tax=Sulfitobacter aestuariivivens TaxID=2766981 RepID=A0A927D7B9_9RHOB|nr:trimethylamine methyltransferase family protein [Sulfitobacter aestuariivivens]MBD3666259.1 trimethylamine methyltransferase family protein [Sulfitobacter aestuariivivens]